MSINTKYYATFCIIYIGDVAPQIAQNCENKQIELNIIV